MSEEMTKPKVLEETREPKESEETTEPKKSEETTEPTESQETTKPMTIKVVCTADRMQALVELPRKTRPRSYRPAPNRRWA